MSLAFAQFTIEVTQKICANVQYMNQRKDDSFNQQGW